MRYALAFTLGLIVGAGLILFLRRPGDTKETARVTSPQVRGNGATASRPQSVAIGSRGAGTSPANASTENAIAAEPEQKEVPAINAPELGPDSIAIPVVDVRRDELRDMFHERRGAREHHAIDIAAPRGTPVVAAIDGTVAKLFLSKPGGMTIYEYDPSQTTIYYYAHLDGYAPGLAEGQPLHRGDVIGFVGTSGNAPPNAPHLHFSIERLTEPGKWWKSEPIDPYPILVARGVTLHRAAAATR